jgi:hypothetical protein
MSFLAPFFLLGAAAIALPIVFHLARRSTLERIPFSSLMFLSPTPPRASRRSRLEHLLLLLLRCAAIALLALGFARPFIQRALSITPQAAPGKRVVLLCDTSASMRREGLWTAAQAKANEILGKLSLADQAALFAFDRQPRALVDFDQWNKADDHAALARRRLAETTPGWSSTQLGSALIAAAEALDMAAKKDSARGAASGEIIVISDLQEGSHLDGLQGYDWPPGVKVSVARITAKPRSNAGLHWASEAAGALTPRVRVSNASDAKKEQFQARWVDPISGRAGSGPPLECYVPPGQNRIAQAPKPEATWTNATLVLTGDEEPFDNTVFWLPPRVEDTYVCYLGNDRDNDPAESLFYLKRALQETPRQNARLLPHQLDEPWPAADLAKARLVVITGALPEDKQRLLKPYLAAGKTAWFVINSETAAATLTGLLETKAAVSEAKLASGYAMLNQIDFEHPLFAPFADPRFGDFTRIHFWKHRQLTLEAAAQARVLARFDDGDIALAQIPVGKGQLLALTTGWRPGDSQLALSSKFVPLLYSLLELSRPAPLFTTQYAVNDEIDFTWLSPAGVIHITEPDGTTVDLPPGTRKFAQTTQPGFYTAAAAELACRFAVNLAPEESRTAPLPMEELERLRVPIAEKAWGADRQAKLAPELKVAAAIENQQKLWRWLIVAAAVVLLMETVLAGWLARRSIATQGSK